MLPAMPSLAFRICSALLLSPCVLAQQLELHPVHSDHCVLQRGRPNRIAGKGKPNAVVVVRFGELEATATADGDGHWTAELPAQPVNSTGRDLVASSGGEEVRARDVLVGEVWVCSGQSNMVWKVRSCSTPEVFAKDADQPTLRMFTAPNQAADQPQRSLRGSWQVCTPDTVLDFSACGYHFGRALLDNLQVPVGLVNVSWGGSSIQAWIRREVLEACPSALPVLEKQRKYAASLKQELADWATADVDDSEWQQTTLPTQFKQLGHDIDGTIAFRRSVDIPDSWRGQELVLSLGPIDDRDVTCFAGKRIGATNRHDRPRSYTIAADMVTGGPTHLAIRVTDTGGPGGFFGAAEDLWIARSAAADDRIALNDGWRAKVISTEPPPAEQHVPAHLFNAMLHPLRHIAPRGVIWYQGENNALRPHGEEYFELFPAMIEDWRAQFGLPEMPFLFVQLPTFGEDHENTVWRYPVVRQAQLQTLLDVPHTGMAITLEVGEPADIHPKNKHDVGRRLARWALSDVYGRTGFVKSGPVPISCTFDGAVARITFDTFGGSLTTRDAETPTPFEVAGPDGTFRAASARIVDNRSILVQAEGITAASAVRYAWRNSPVTANVVGGDGLPASPFTFSKD